MLDDETLLFQLVDDLQEMFNNSENYSDVTVKQGFDGDYDIEYPLVVVRELSNTDSTRYFDGKEHIVNVGYQIEIHADQKDDIDAATNVIYIQNLIKHYMRGERYNALKRIGPSPILDYAEDSNIKIGYMRYYGCINIDTHTIYRRN